MSTRRSRLLVVGHPLLDLIVEENGEALLEKYSLKPNNMILADPEHAAIYGDILQNYKPVIVPGGDANIARAAAYILPKDDVAFMGTVGADSRGKLLTEANEREGVRNVVHVEEIEETGACAVVIQGVNRSLVTNLCAARLFADSHLDQPEILSLIQSVNQVYISGYFLSHGIDSALRIANTVDSAKQILTLNLAAPFIAQFFMKQLDTLIPYADYVLGNESEAAAWAAAHEITESNTVEIAKLIAALPKRNKRRPRVVVITQGPNHTIVVSSDSSGTVKEYPVKPAAAADIVDTNGAGDSFAGGFIAAVTLGKSIDEAVEVGHRLGRMCIGQIGAQLRFPKEDLLEGL